MHAHSSISVIPAQVQLTLVIHMLRQSLSLL